MSTSVLVAGAIGVLVGVVVGALGAGGGVLSVPVLVYLLGQDPHEAATSSLVIVLVTALVALRSRWRRGQVQWRTGLVFAGTASLGAWSGSWLNAQVGPQVLVGGLGVLLALVSLLMARSALRLRRSEAATATPGQDAAGADPTSAAEGPDAGSDEPSGQNGWRRQPVVLVLAALLTGVLTGFFGVGGGFIVVPILTMGLGIDVRRAAGTSLLVIVIMTTVSLAQRSTGEMSLDLPVVLVFSLASALGGLIGGPVSQKLRASTLTAMFSLLLAGIAACTLLDLVTH